jgi:hypothetical protein
MRSRAGTRQLNQNCEHCCNTGFDVNWRLQANALIEPSAKAYNQIGTSKQASLSQLPVCRRYGTFDLLPMNYPASHRLERRGWVVSKWEMAPDRNREFKYCRLTEKGRKQLVFEEAQWKQIAEAVARVMWPADEGN